MMMTNAMEFSWKNALAPFNIFVAVSVFVLDQLTKIAVILWIPLGRHIPVLPFFDLVHTKNKGAAFGIFHDSSPIVRFVIFGAVSVVCLYLLLHWLGTTQRKAIWQRLALALILGGALGNLLDRACFGQVTDFLDVYYQSYHWPAFNIADSAISVGVTILALHFIQQSIASFKERRAQKMKSAKKK